MSEAVGGGVRAAAEGVGSYPERPEWCAEEPPRALRAKPPRAPPPSEDDESLLLLKRLARPEAETRCVVGGDRRGRGAWGVRNDGAAPRGALCLAAEPPLGSSVRAAERLRGCERTSEDGPAVRAARRSRRACGRKPREAALVGF